MEKRSLQEIADDHAQWAAEVGAPAFTQQDFPGTLDPFREPQSLASDVVAEPATVPGSIVSTSESSVAPSAPVLPEAVTSETSSTTAPLVPSEPVPSTLAPTAEVSPPVVEPTPVPAVEPVEPVVDTTPVADPPEIAGLE